MILFLVAACVPADRGNGTTVVEDTAFTNRFLPSGDGFTGADGTYSVKLPGGETIWIFGDTFLGNVTPDHHRVKTTPAYIRNSFVMLEGSGLKTFHQGEPREFKSMMIPPEVTDGSSGKTELQLWYWPGAGFVSGDKLNVFASKFSQEDHNDMWGFRFEATELVEFSLPDLKPVKTHRFHNLDSIHFGHALLETDRYFYIYGLKKGRPYVARTGRSNITAPWEFYNGSYWINDATRSKPILDFHGSEQFSVFEWNGQYIMIMQEGNLGRKIYSFTSVQPWGPWINKKMIYETPELKGCPKCWTYNALAHPQFMEDGQLLISYNTNSMNMDDHYANALIYRPRFIRVPMDLITVQP